MQTGVAVPFKKTGSNSHCPIATTIALLNGGNGGVNSTSRVGHT